MLVLHLITATVVSSSRVVVSRRSPLSRSRARVARPGAIALMPGAFATSSRVLADFVFTCSQCWRSVRVPCSRSGRHRSSWRRSSRCYRAAASILDRCAARQLLPFLPIVQIRQYCNAVGRRLSWNTNRLRNLFLRCAGQPEIANTAVAFLALRLVNVLHPPRDAPDDKATVRPGETPPHIVRRRPTSGGRVVDPRAGTWTHSGGFNASQGHWARPRGILVKRHHVEPRCFPNPSPDNLDCPQPRRCFRGEAVPPGDAWLGLRVLDTVVGACSVRENRKGSATWWGSVGPRRRRRRCYATSSSSCCGAT
jgi:hypothetical protein